MPKVRGYSLRTAGIHFRQNTSVQLLCNTSKVDANMSLTTGSFTYGCLKVLIAKITL